MARPTKTTRTPAKQAPQPAPKKRIGRPVGSKNRVPSAAKAPPIASSRRALSKKAAAPTAPKLNKAELEAHVVKLERSITRLRKQNAELKQAAREGAAEAAKAAAAVPEKKPKRHSMSKPRRAAKPAPNAETAATSADEDEKSSTSEG